MKWREIDSTSDSRKFRIVGELARNWDKAKQTHGFDDLIQTVKHKYRLDITHEMSGIAFHGLLHSKSIDFAVKLNSLIKRNNDARRF